MQNEKICTMLRIGEAQNKSIKFQIDSYMGAIESEEVEEFVYLRSRLTINVKKRR